MTGIDWQRRSDRFNKSVVQSDGTAAASQENGLWGTRKKNKWERHWLKKTKPPGSYARRSFRREGHPQVLSFSAAQKRAGRNLFGLVSYYKMRHHEESNPLGGRLRHPVGLRFIKQVVVQRRNGQVRGGQDFGGGKINIRERQTEARGLGAKRVKRGGR